MKCAQSATLQRFCRLTAANGKTVRPAHIIPYTATYFNETLEQFTFRCIPTMEQAAGCKKLRGL